MAVEKRVRFKSWWLPWVLIAPQMAIILVFFFWPAGQALYQSVLQQDAFGTSTEFVGLENFERLWNDATYLDVVQDHRAVLGAGRGRAASAISLLLAVMADRVVRGAARLQDAADLALRGGAGGGRRAVAVHVRAVDGHRRATRCGALGIEWNHLLNANHAMALIVMAAVWKQISYNFLFFLAGLQSIPKSLIEAAAIDGARPWRRFWTIVVPAAVADHLLPAGDQHRLRLLRHLRDRRRRDAGRPGQGHRDPGLQGLLRRLQGARPRRLGGAVGGADGRSSSR